MLDNATLGRFVLQEEIGRGGMARVFSAYHQNDGTPVAVKLMLPGLDETSEAEPSSETDMGTMQVVFEEAEPQSDFAQAFGYEVQAAAQLDHPCVTTVYDHGFVTGDEERGRELPEGAPWLAMELVSGGTLADDIAARRWPELRQIVLDVLDGLAHAHARGLIHRDVKPGNVLVDALTERVKLADFGLAHSIQGEREGALADTASIIGTPAYMAPEQIEARWQDYGPWTDLYAVGVMAWTLSTGRPPYQGSVTMVLQGHLKGALPTFEAAHAMPAGFLGWVKGMMHPLSTGRFRRAADAAWALTQLGEAEEETDEGAQVTAAIPQLQSLVMNPVGPTMAMPRASELEALQAKGLKAALFGHALVRAPIPVSWRTPRQPRRHLHGAGLALFEHRSTGLVGRVAERDRLWQALQTVTLDERLSALLLDGPSGAGKSTLARWLTERSDEVGAAQHLEVSHSASDGAADGLGPMLSRHFRIKELNRAEAVARVAERLAQLGIENREEAVALTELARPSTDEEHAVAGLSVRFGGPRERHVLLARYLGHLASIRPVVLWMDDLVHGPDTRDFLAHLLEADLPGPLLVLTTADSELLAERGEDIYDALLSHARSERITLAPLNREEQSALVRELLGLEPELAAQVEHRSAGNPLFAVQLVGDWIQRGLLVTGEEGFRLADGADARMPDNLAQVWRQRVEQLFVDRSSDEMGAIELAAVLGQDVDREEWEDVCAAGGLALPKALLSDLMRRRLVTSHGEYLGWSFAHAMIHEAVIERAEAGGRHAGWASLCADVLTDRPHTIVRRARYLLKAERTEEAIAPLLDGVRREISVGELDRARALQALRDDALNQLGLEPDELAPMQGEILDIQLRRLSGMIEQAGREAENFLRRARKLNEPRLVAEALHTLASAKGHLGELDIALTYMEEAMDIARRLRFRSYPSICIDVCFIHMRQGAHHKCMERAREVIFSGEALGEPGHVARGYAMLARATRQAGHSETAEFFLEEARLRFEREGNRNGLAVVWNTLGELKREAGDLQGAEGAYTEASVRFDACGSAAGCYSRLNLGMTFTTADKHQDAIDTLVQVRDEAARIGHSTIIAALHVIRLPALVSLGEWTTVELELAEAERTISDMGLVDVDIANFAQMAAQRCDTLERPELARRCWTIAHVQWTAMGRQDDADEAAAHL